MNNINNDIGRTQNIKNYNQVKKNANKFIKIYYYKYISYWFDIALYIIGILLSFIFYINLKIIIIGLILQLLFGLGIYLSIIDIKFWKKIYKKIKNYELFENLAEIQVDYILERHYNKIVKSFWFCYSISRIILSIYAKFKWKYEEDYLAVFFEEKGFAKYPTNIDLHSYVSEFKRKKY